MSSGYTGDIFLIIIIYNIIQQKQYRIARLKDQDQDQDWKLQSTILPGVGRNKNL